MKETPQPSMVVWFALQSSLHCKSVAVQVRLLPCRLPHSEELSPTKGALLRLCHLVIALWRVHCHAASIALAEFFAVIGAGDCDDSACGGGRGCVSGWFRFRSRRANTACVSMHIDIRHCAWHNGTIHLSGSRLCVCVHSLGGWQMTEKRTKIAHALAWGLRGYASACAMNDAVP